MFKLCTNVRVFQDREFVEMEIPYNGQPKRPGSPSPLGSPAHSASSRPGLLHACCGRCCGQRYQVSQPFNLSFTPHPPTSLVRLSALRPYGLSVSQANKLLVERDCEPGWPQTLFLVNTRKITFKFYNNVFGNMCTYIKIFTT